MSIQELGFVVLGLAVDDLTLGSSSERSYRSIPRIVVVVQPRVVPEEECLH